MSLKGPVLPEDQKLKGGFHVDSRNFAHKCKGLLSATCFIPLKAKEDESEKLRTQFSEVGFFLIDQLLSYNIGGKLLRVYLQVPPLAPV
jgi:hypothetical protein